MMNESKEISGCPMHHAEYSDDKTPLVVRQMNKSKRYGSGNAYAVPSRRPWHHRKASQALHICALKKPNGLYAKIVKFWFRVVYKRFQVTSSKCALPSVRTSVMPSLWFYLNGTKWLTFFLSLLKPEHSVWEQDLW